MLAALLTALPSSLKTPAAYASGCALAQARPPYSADHLDGASAVSLGGKIPPLSGSRRRAVLTDTGARGGQREGEWAIRSIPSTVRRAYHRGVHAPNSCEMAISSGFVRVSDGIRTHDRLDHNQELYQLSYAHRGRLNLASRRPLDGPAGGRGPERVERKRLARR